MSRVAHFLRSESWFTQWASVVQSPCFSLLCLGLSGFPDSVPVYAVNRQCSSGLQALFNIAGKNWISCCFTDVKRGRVSGSSSLCLCRSHQERIHRPGSRLRVSLCFRRNEIKFQQETDTQHNVCVYSSVESMSLRSATNPGDLSSRLVDHDKARDCLIPMGWDLLCLLWLKSWKIIIYCHKLCL